jgi:hypothetical protein
VKAARSLAEWLGPFKAAEGFFEVLHPEKTARVAMRVPGDRRVTLLLTGEMYRAEPLALATPAQKYTYNMVDNPGPLADLPGNPAANFAGGRYNEIILYKDTTLYRGGKSGEPLGQWFIREPPKSVALDRIASAVRPHWTDAHTGVRSGSSPIDTAFSVKIPGGTTVYLGPTAYQGGIYKGTREQIFVPTPWSIPGVEVIGSKPIR